MIDYALKNKLTVGFAIPRRDVVIELAKRMESAFKGYIVTCVYGGNNSLLVGDIVCLTTHQLYRYKNYFDLLILDEIDAFPYKGNEVLNNIFKRSIKSHYILMSATPSKKEIEEFNSGNNKMVTLFKRHHGRPIPVPKIKVMPSIFSYWFLIKKTNEFINKGKPLLIFVPTIFDCKNVYFLLKNFAKQGFLVHSQRKDREQIIDDFRTKKYKYLVTTAVLERGVTLKNLQVIIFKADSEIYSSSALIQISGRVGRVNDAPDGEIIYIGKRKTKEMLESIETIKHANESL